MNVIRRFALSITAVIVVTLFVGTKTKNISKKNYNINIKYITKDYSHVEIIIFYFVFIIINFTIVLRPRTGKCGNYTVL